MAKADFKVIKEIIQPDSRGRITLGASAKAKSYRVLSNDLGEILLEPVVTIPEREAWLYKNQDALAAIQQGLAESAAGESRSLGSFV
ncbi:hypothetical protein [Picosynechococcus sp. NKBG042902]|uniref:hypothetical protein n=1 Tax=Picosynechococcus sp. NKBG042902 TaxID=490193 RepID=UPI0004AA2194|nr:hypothetical protein [Picosynechococcus sp. NKBG042902]